MAAHGSHGHRYTYHPDVVPYTRTTAFLFAPGAPTSAVPPASYPSMDWRTLRGALQEGRATATLSATHAPTLRPSAAALRSERPGRGGAPAAAPRATPGGTLSPDPSGQAPHVLSPAHHPPSPPPPLVSQRRRHHAGGRADESAQMRERVGRSIVQIHMQAPAQHADQPHAPLTNGGPVTHHSHAHSAAHDTRPSELGRRERSRYSDLDAVWIAGAPASSSLYGASALGQRQPFGVAAATAAATARLYTQLIDDDQDNVEHFFSNADRRDGVRALTTATREAPNCSPARGPQPLPDGRLNVRPAQLPSSPAPHHETHRRARYSFLAPAEQAAAHHVHLRRSTEARTPTKAGVVEPAFAAAASLALPRAANAAETSSSPRPSTPPPSTPLQRRVWVDEVPGSSGSAAALVEASVRRRLEALAAALTDGDVTGASAARTASPAADWDDARAVAVADAAEAAVPRAESVSATSVLSPLSPQRSRPSPLSDSGSVSGPSLSSHATSPSAVRGRLTYGSAQDDREPEEAEDSAAPRRRRHSSPRGSISPLSRLYAGDVQLPLPLPPRQPSCRLGIDLEGQRCALLLCEEAAEREWLAVDATVRLHRLACEERAALQVIEYAPPAPSSRGVGGGAGGGAEPNAAGPAAAEVHDSPSTTPAERRQRRLPSASSLPPLSPRTPVLSRLATESSSDFSDVCTDESGSEGVDAAGEETDVEGAEASRVDTEDTADTADTAEGPPTKANAAAAAPATGDGAAGEATQRGSGNTLPPPTSPSRSPPRRLRTFLEEEEDLRFLITGACPPPEVFQRWADRYLEGQRAADAAPARAAGAPSTDASLASVHTSYTAEEAEAAAATTSPAAPRATPSPPLSPPAAAPRGRNTAESPPDHRRGDSAPRTTSPSQSPAPRPVAAGVAEHAELYAAAAAEAQFWRDTESSPSAARQRRCSERHHAWATDGFLEEVSPEGGGHARRSGTATSPAAGDGSSGWAGSEVHATGRYAPLPRVFVGAPTPPSSSPASPATSSPSAASRPAGGEAAAATSETSSQPRHSSQLAGSSSFSLHVVAPPTEETYLPPVGSERDALQALMDLFIDGLLQIVERE